MDVVDPTPADIPLLVTLSGVPGIGSRTLDRLLDAFGSMEAAWDAPRDRLDAVLPPPRAQLVAEARTTASVSAAMAAVQLSDVRVVIRGEPEYPRYLAEVAAPPVILFVCGRRELLDNACIAVVGTRRMTNYGGRVTRLLAEGLARYGVTVVSGLARGVDTQAHQAALSAKGATAAVLGCGPDIVFPASNRRLHARLLREGCVVSEYPPGTPAVRSHFPARNRVIAGLSLATVVVEAGASSGALITARFATDEGRQVCAVPGAVGAVASEGTHLLLRSGASAVSSFVEVLVDAQLGDLAKLAEQEVAGANEADPAAAAVLRQLSQGPMDVDQLARALGTPASELAHTLTMLEIKGLAALVGAEWSAA